MKKHILVVDDDQRILTMFERILTRINFRVTICSSAFDAIEKMQHDQFDLIISDQSLNEMDGIELLAKAQKFAPNVPFIVITGYGTIERAVESVKKGAFDYLIKPFGRDHILKVIDRAMEQTSFRLNKVEQPNAFQNIIGSSPKMAELFNLISKVAPTNSTVLIQGESGTGKELIAKAIHQLSPRKNGVFIAINCGVLSENLLDNELFGHVKGAFTGATPYKKGLFEEADRGTLFLDEVAEIPPAVQAKLLRVLQEKEFKPLGSNEVIKVDVRVIAATNADLYKSVEEKKFRNDLYYRLAVIHVWVPPLRERLDDIPALALYFAHKYSQQNGKKIQFISPEAMEKLKSHIWKGNVRELENTIEGAVALATSDSITLDLLWQGTPDRLLKTESTEETKENKYNTNISNPEFDRNAEIEENVSHGTSKISSLDSMIEETTRHAIFNTLEYTKGNYAETARILGITRATLYHKIQKYGIEFRSKDRKNHGRDQHSNSQNG